MGGGGGHSYNFQKNIVFLSLRIVFVLVNSAGPDEMPHHALLHCLPKYPFNFIRALFAKLSILLRGF